MRTHADFVKAHENSISLGGARHPTFKSGHCFMTETLNKQEVEFVGALLHEHLNRMHRAVPEEVERFDYLFEVRRTNAVLKKMDYPLFEEDAS